LLLAHDSERFGRSGMDCDHEVTRCCGWLSQMDTQ
jgi:hypothetical protein